MILEINTLATKNNAVVGHPLRSMLFTKLCRIKCNCLLNTHLNTNFVVFVLFISKTSYAYASITSFGYKYYKNAKIQVSKKYIQHNLSLKNARSTKVSQKKESET